MEQHAALGLVLVQLLVEQQEEDVSGVEEEWGENRGAQRKLGLGQIWKLILLLEFLSGWGAGAGKQFSKIIVSTEP